MPRPHRIEYENAFYHVMNRGRARLTIFHDERYYQAFLETLEEAHQRFRCVIHCYCLMGNHYHLLLETPEANLSSWWTKMPTSCNCHVIFIVIPLI